MAQLSTTTKPIYFTGLNGIRAIAALAVVIGHTTGALTNFGLSNIIPGQHDKVRMELAGSAVTLFFTLSGFLITFLLLKEKEVTQVHIRSFYMRRILRIWPLYYLYFFICLGISLYIGVNIKWASVVCVMFFSANIPFMVPGISILPLVSQYWSLGVEEQFYLFFPWIARFSNKKLMRISLLLLGILLTIKCCLWVLMAKYKIEWPYNAMTFIRFQMMLIGVVGAILYYNNDRVFMAVATHKVTQLIAWSCVFLNAISKFHIASAIDQELVSVLGLFLIIGQVTGKGIINLENKVCNFIGKISYGIYVIHVLVIFMLGYILPKSIDHSVLDYVRVYACVLAITIGLAYLSYEFYEKQFLKLKKRYTIVKSTNTA